MRVSFTKIKNLKNNKINIAIESKMFSKTIMDYNYVKKIVSKTLIHFSQNEQYLLLE